MDVTPHAQPYTLGIDLGTSSIKVAIVDAAGSVVENVTVPSLATITSSVGEDGVEQCPVAIWSALQSGLRQLDPDNQVKVSMIGDNGRMLYLRFMFVEVYADFIYFSSSGCSYDAVSLTRAREWHFITV